jgi:hypothetical protein
MKRLRSFSLLVERRAAPKPASTPAGGRSPYAANGGLQPLVERRAAPKPASTPAGVLAPYPANGGPQ